MSHPPLEIDIYQIADDTTLKRQRTDGTGWDWGWPPRNRDWMDSTPSRHAYRCLPLTMANQMGWWVCNPVGFSAVWNGGRQPGSIQFSFEVAAELWAGWINNQFGEGIITWNTPFLFRTRPAGSRLMVCGPANYFKANLHPLTALIESDWLTMSFTMNWKIMRPGEPVRYDAGEPLFQVIPLAGNLSADLERATVHYARLAENPEVAGAYRRWQQERNQFHRRKARGEESPDGWQKDYFQGPDPSQREVALDHRTKVTPP
jgi:hypothetical protein